MSRRILLLFSLFLLFAGISQSENICEAGEDGASCAENNNLESEIERAMRQGAEEEEVKEKNEEKIVVENPMVALLNNSPMIALLHPKEGDLIRPVFDARIPDVAKTMVLLDLRVENHNIEEEGVALLVNGQRIRWVFDRLSYVRISQVGNVRLEVCIVSIETEEMVSCSHANIVIESWVPHPGLGPVHLYSVFSLNRSSVDVENDIVKNNNNNSHLHNRTIPAIEIGDNDDLPLTPNAVADSLGHRNFEDPENKCSNLCTMYRNPNEAPCPAYTKWLHDESCPFLPRTPPPVGKYRIAIVSANTRSNEHPGFGISKACYALKFNYSYIEAHEHASQRRADHWTRVEIVERYLSFFDWVVWLDYDTVITNDALPIEHYLPDYGREEEGEEEEKKMDDRSRVDLIVTDWQHIICTGGFIVRNSKWTRRFLAKWWEYGDDRYTQSYYDQGAFNRAWMAMTADELGIIMHDHDRIHDLYLLASFFHALGRPFGRRGCLSHVLFWSSEMQSPRGFNFFARNRENVVAGFSACNMYLPGDLLLHNHDNRAVSIHTRWPLARRKCTAPWGGQINATTGLVDLVSQLENDDEQGVGGGSPAVLWGTDKWQAAYVPFSEE